MAQSKSFFGLRRGSTKSHTFSVFNGKQITKDRVDSIKNPRSEAQMLQRMIMKTAGLAYSEMKAIVDHSFEGVTYGLQSMMKFSSENARLMRADIENGGQTFGFAPYKALRMHGGAFVISKGSLPSPVAPATFENMASRSVPVKLGTLAGTTITADALMSQLGVVAGDMLTACFIADVDTNFGVAFGFVRFTFLKGGTTALTSENLAEYVLIESNKPIVVTLGSAAAAPVFSVAVSIADSEISSGTVCGATILSRKADAKWLRSSERINVGDAYDPQLDWETALATYPIGQSFILNGGEI